MGKLHNIADYRKQPRTPKIINYPHQIVVRISDEENGVLMTISEQCGITVSEAIRQLIVSARVVPPAPIRDAVNELNKIGVNLNQLAKTANKSGHISTLQLTEQMADLKQTLAALGRCI